MEGFAIGVIVAEFSFCVGVEVGVVLFILVHKAGGENRAIAFKLTVAEAFFHKNFVVVALSYIKDKVNFAGEDVCQVDGEHGAFALVGNGFKEAGGNSTGDVGELAFVLNRFFGNVKKGGVGAITFYYKAGRVIYFVFKAQECFCGGVVLDMEGLSNADSFEGVEGFCYFHHGADFGLGHPFVQDNAGCIAFIDVTVEDLPASFGHFIHIAVIFGINL